MKTYTRAGLKRSLSSIVAKIQPIPAPNISLTKAEQKTLLGNEKIISDLKLALKLFDVDFNKSCSLISEIPYKIVSPSPDLDISVDKIVGSDMTYKKTDSLRHMIRMLPEHTFSKRNSWNNNVVAIG